ncbi:MAG: hypothetical protein ABL923_06700 [Burkholderiaceae bacterium]
MNIHQKIIGASLMFTITTSDKSRTNPPVQTLANLRSQITEKQDQLRELKLDHKDANLAIRKALKVGKDTATARVQVIDVDAQINTCVAEINEMQSMVDQVTAATIDHDALTLTQSAQSGIDQALAVFDLSKFDHTAESIV